MQSSKKTSELNSKNDYQNSLKTYKTETGGHKKPSKVLDYEEYGNALRQ